MLRSLARAGGVSDLYATSLSIERIAPRCGFASPGALSSAFLRQTGVRPSAYRKN